MSTVPPLRPVTVPEFRAAKARGAKLAVVTAYDYTTARLCDEAGVDAILVGDSLGMVVQGHPTSLPVTLDEMIYHTRCVVRGVRRALVVADLPFMTYQVSPQQAVRNAGRLLKEGGAHAVKLEGGVRMHAAVKACRGRGHPGDGPRRADAAVGPPARRVQGAARRGRNSSPTPPRSRTRARSRWWWRACPAELGAKITAAVTIPTIGIGAGADCDGQVLVFHDMLGLFPDFKPKFAKRYADLGTQVKAAVEAYCREVRDGSFPAAEHTFR